MIGKTVAHYEIVRKLGEGGMGVVYEAHDSRLKRSVAVKALPPDKTQDPDRRRRFLQEARSASGLDHPGIVTIHDLVTHEGGDWIVMELIRGESLRCQIPPHGLPWPEAARYAGEIADAMAAAHAAGIVHRDLNPNNVMITERGSVKVLDFGIAKLDPDRSPEETVSGTLTAPGQATGTYAYMSPEQALGEPVDARSDIFSLGVLTYEMLTGKRPFSGTNAAALLHEIHYGEPEPIDSEVPEDLRRVVERALSKSPEMRYPTMEDLREALTDGSPTQITTPAPSDAENSGYISNEAATRGPNLSAQLARWVLPSIALVAVIVWAMSAGLRTGERAMSADDPFALYQEGTALLSRYEKKGNLEKATASFQRLMRLDETSAAGHAGLARSYWRAYREGSLDPQLLRQALAVAQRAVTLDDHLAEARLSLGLVLTGLGRLEEAESELETALELDPALAAAWAGLADIHKQHEKFEEAESAYLKALELAPKDRELHDAVGTLYFIEGRYAEAELAYLRSVEIAPDGPYGYRNLSGVYFAQGRYGEAATVLQKALAIQPRSSLYSNLGTIFFYQGLYEQAVTAFEKALDLEGGNRYPLWINLGDAYRWTPDNQEKASTAFRQAAGLLRGELESRPDDPELQSRLALCLAKQGDRKAALEELKKLGTLEGRAGRVLFRATLAFEILGQRRQAIETLGAALRAGHPLAAFRDDPELLDLRADPRYHQTVLTLSQNS